MASGLDRRVLAALLAGSVLVLALVLVARGNAGSSNASFTTFVGPSQLTAGQTGFVGAKFKPDGKGLNNGSATHVVITLTFPTGTQDIVLTTCPGSASYSGLMANCDIGTVQNGQQVRVFATYTAGSADTAALIDGNVKWDVPKGGGNTGGTNGIDAPSTVAIFSATGATFAGKCTTAASDSVGASDPSTGKATTVTYGTVDDSLGFPCTPAQAGVDPDTTVRGHTPGIWSLLVAPLAGGALGQAVLTLNPLPRGVNFNNAQLFEVIGNPVPANLHLVPSCLSGGALPAGVDACITGQVKFDKGVQFFVNVQGSSLDPSFTS
jgi:hypothetical protein